MKRALSVVLTLGLLTGAALMPATAEAKKKKTIKDSFQAQGVPFPHPDGCIDGVEGVQKVSHTFETPAKGLLEVNMHTFDGDWDLFVTDADGNVLGSSTSGQPIDPPGETVAVAVGAKSEVLIVACNWSGAPTSTVDYVFTY
jgi:hypothetical protein